MLTESGGGIVSVERIRADLELGAPSNPDGTLDLLHYGAWLVANAERPAAA